jgi:hypothetical protein
MQFLLTKPLSLAAACFFSIILFAHNVTYLDVSFKPATTGIEAWSFPIQTQLKVNQTPEVIKIKTVRGKLGRKNRESTEKLSFTEIDLSKYESGHIFADFRVSSGGCDAALVAASVPTEDRKQLLELTRALSGGTAKANPLALSSGHIRLLNKRVNKFYVSGLLIPVGMAAWYSKDCVGSYEITIYIKNARASSAPSRKSVPCDDDEVQVSYDTSSPNYHSYRVKNRICSTNVAGCHVWVVFMTMISQVRYITPTEDTSPVKHCMKIDVDIIPGPFGSDYVRTVLDFEKFSVTNYTKKDHLLHPGKVTRTIVERGGAIYVETFGEGTGFFGEENVERANGVWTKVDKRLIEAVRR